VFLDNVTALTADYQVKAEERPASSLLNTPAKQKSRMNMWFSGITITLAF